MRSCARIFILGGFAFGGLSFITGPAAFADKCNDSYRAILFEERPYVGTPATAKGFESEDTRLLGNGEMGGHVYLVRPRDQSPAYVVKIYNAGGPTVARNDRIAFAILNQSLNAAAKAGTLRSIEKVEQLDALTLKLGYVAGRDIEDVSWKIGSDRERLSKLFLRQLREAKRKLDAKGTFTVDGATYRIVSSNLKPHGYENKAILHMVLENLDPEARPAKVRITLKSDGVVLTRDGQFVVIDPS